MTLAKRLLLGTAAAFVATSGAHAADLGLPVAPSVEYVQVCSIGTFTGFLLPGGDVCFQISGYARGQLTWTEEIDTFEWDTGDALTLFSALGDTGAAQPWGPTVGATVTIAAGTPLPNAPTQVQLDAYNLQMRTYAAQFAGLSVRATTAADGYNLSLIDNVMQGHSGTTIVDASAGNGTIIGDIAALSGALQVTAAGAAQLWTGAANNDWVAGLDVLNVAGDNDEMNFLGNGRLNFDARTMTEYGLLRGFIRLDGENGTAANVDHAYVQLNMGSIGFTAGRAASAFDPEFTGYGAGVAGLYVADQASNQFSVNAAVGNGVTVSLSVEDDDGRNGSILGLRETRVATDATLGNGGLWTLSEIGYDGGASMPDFIAAIRVGQAWGSVKLAGALHEVNPASAGLGTNSADIDSEYGYAVSASAEFNLPIGVGSTFGITGIYANGAQQFMGFDTEVGNAVTGFADGIVVTTDPNAAAATSSLELTTSYVLAAGFNFGLSNELVLHLDGAYADVDHFGSLFDGNIYTVRGGMTYTPVQNLSLAGTVAYTAADFNTSNLRTAVDDDEWSARFRVTRSF